MATKKIKANKATQVNSNLIGVKVEPIGDFPINCEVFYSVDGVYFTGVGTVLTDQNNVIANIPRYVYLKFSQDVVITEE